MKGKKSTRSALLTSITSLVLCFAMLLGTTFAWFTDTASTAVNTIQAGTLDVQLLDADGHSLEGQTLEFKKATGAAPGEQVLWEPGCTYELPAFVVKNNGNLTLKYKIVLSGIDGDAKLNEVIDWTMNGAAVGTEYTLAPGASSDAITIKGHMQESAGNEYQGLTIDGIAITVYATQKDAEFDSFNNSYDAGATYPVEIIPAVESNMTPAVPVDGTVSSYSFANSDNTLKATYVPNTAVAATEPAPKVVVEPTSKDAGNVRIEAATQDAIAYDISLKDATGTTVLQNTGVSTFTMKVGTGLTGVTVYHNATPLTPVATEEALDVDKFYYNSTNGTVAFMTSSFSPFTIVFDAPVATLGDGTPYYTLSAAVADAKNGDTVTILRDFTENGQITFPEDKTLTVDWNGKTVKAQGDNRGFWANIEGTVTFKGDGYVGDTTHESVGYLLYVTGTLNIEGNATYECGLTVAQMSSMNSKLYISGGRFIGDQWSDVYWTLNKLDQYRDSAVISVTGGSFYKYDPSNGNTESPDDNFVASGYGAIQDGDWYKVISGTVVSTAEELQAAIANGGTIYLANDIQGGGLTTPDRNPGTVIIDFNGHTYSVNNPGVGSSGTETQAMHWSKGSDVTLKNGSFVVMEGSTEIGMAMQNYGTFTAENMVFDFSVIPVDHYGYWSPSSGYGDYSYKEIPMFCSNGAPVTLTKCTVKMPADSTRGIAADEAGPSSTIILNECTIDGYVCCVDLDSRVINNGSTWKGFVSYFDKYEPAHDGNAYYVVEKTA